MHFLGFIPVTSLMVALTMIIVLATFPIVCTWETQGEQRNNIYGHLKCFAQALFTGRVFSLKIYMCKSLPSIHSPSVLRRWTLSPHWGGLPPTAGAGCPSVASCLYASEPASSADSPQPEHGLLHPQNPHGQPAQSSPPGLTPGHGPARPSSG